MDVVIVDDDTALLRSLEIILCAEGHRVTVFSDPSVAYTFFKQGGSADVLILDYVLPGVTGKRFLELLRRYVPRLDDSKVIIITGHMEMIDGAKLKAIGAMALLPKPLHLSELCDLVSSG